MSFSITGPGGPTTVNAPDDNPDFHPAVAALGSGGWAAVWEADDTIRGRLFGPEGTPLTASDFLVHAAAATSLSEPRIARLMNDGGFVVVWSSNNGGAEDVYLRRYDASGAEIDDVPILVSEAGPTANHTPDVAGLADGGFVVTWSGAGVGSDPDVYMRRFDSDGTPHAQSAVPNTSGSQLEVAPRVVALDDGWAIASTEGNGTARDIWLRRFDSHGVMRDPMPIVVNEANDWADAAAALAAVGGGRLVVAWRSEQDASAVMQRVIGADGVPLSQAQVNVLAAFDVTDVAVTALPDGGWVTAFHRMETNSSDDVYLRRYSTNGVPTEPSETLVSAGTGMSPAAALVEPETLVILWSESAQGGTDIVQRLLRLAMTTGVDVADGTAGAETLAIAPGTLSAGDTVDGKGGIDTLALSAAGTIDLRLPASLTGIEALVGSPGADIVVTDAARLVPFASFDGGAGHDTLVLAGGGTFSFAGKSLLGFERIAVEGAAPAVVFLSPGADVAEGGAGGDTLFGADGGDALSGGAGNDALVGGPGDDSLSGGDGADALSGEAGNDVLAGSSGNDVLSGADGADALSGEAGNDRLAGDLGNDRLSGGLGVDTLKGGVGNDRLAGGLGKDALTGGKGKDVFVFDTKLSSANLDKVLDFNVRDDSFQLDNAVFRKLGKGTPAKPVKLGADAFFKGKAAEDKEDRILYDKASGALFYDADGIGAAKAVKVAILKKGLALTHSDFFVI